VTAQGREESLKSGLNLRKKAGEGIKSPGDLESSKTTRGGENCHRGHLNLKLDTLKTLSSEGGSFFIKEDRLISGKRRNLVVNAFEPQSSWANLAGEIVRGEGRRGTARPSTEKKGPKRDGGVRRRKRIPSTVRLI